MQTKKLVEVKKPYQVLHGWIVVYWGKPVTGTFSSNEKEVVESFFDMYHYSNASIKKARLVVEEIPSKELKIQQVLRKLDKR